MPAVSLRIVVASLLALVAITTAVIGFVPMYIVGLESVQDTMRSLRASLVKRAQTDVEAFIDRPFRIIESVEALSKRGAIDTNNVWNLVLAACDIALANSDSIGIVQFVMLPYATALCSPSSQASLSMLYIAPNNLSNVMDWSYIDYDPATDTYTKGGLVSNASTRRVVARSVTVLYPDAPLFSQGKRFLPISIGQVGPQMAGGGPLYAPNGSLIGCTRIELRPLQVSLLLRSLGLSPNGRAFVFDRSNGYLVGVSWNESTALLNATSGKYYAMKSPVNMTDGLALSVYRALGNATLSDAASGFSTDVGGAADRVYVDFVDVVRNGISLRAVLAMPESDFLADVFAKRTATLAGIGSALVVVILLGVVVAHFLTQPLSRLSDRMYATASFEDEEADDPPSLLAEVRDMQEAYGTMRTQLNQAKTFLPQAVFRKHRRDDDDDGSGGSASEVVVTDPHSGSKSPTQSQSRHVSNSSPSHVSSTAGSRSAKDVTGLSTAIGASRRSVTVLVINVSRTHEFCDRHGARFVDEHARVVEAVTAAVNGQRGVLDTFHGDHFVATFNATSNVAGHARRAAHVALGVRGGLDKLKALNTATMGISTGMAYVGNMGSKELTRFCTVGPVFSEAVALERLCPQYRNGDHPVFALATLGIAVEAQLELYLQYVDVVALLGRKTLAVSVEAAKAVAMDEWMYQLQEGDAKDPFAGINATMREAFNDATLSQLAAAVARLPASKFAGYGSLQRMVRAA